MSQLRFRKSQAAVLRNTAERLKRNSHPADVVGVVEAAASAARLGQPLDVPPGQAATVANALERLGAARPQILT